MIGLKAVCRYFGTIHVQNYGQKNVGMYIICIYRTAVNTKILNTIWNHTKILIERQMSIYHCKNIDYCMFFEISKVLLTVPRSNYFFCLSQTSINSSKTRWHTVFHIELTKSIEYHCIPSYTKYWYGQLYENL